MKTEILVRPPESKSLKSRMVILSPGESVGEHITNKREELIIVLRGTATILYNHHEVCIKKGETYFIKEGILHDIKNNHDEELEYVYVVSVFE